MIIFPKNNPKLVPLKQIIIKTFVFLIFILSLSCGENEEKFAVAVATNTTYAYLSKQVLYTKKYSKRKGHVVYTVNNQDKKSIHQTIPSSMLVFLDSEDDAKRFEENYRPYVDTNIVSNKQTIMRESPHINAEKKLILDPNTELFIISPIVSPNDVYYDSSTIIQNTNIEDDPALESLSKGYWIRIQYFVDLEKKKYVRGWILVTHDNIIVFNKKNTLNASTLIDSFPNKHYWRTTEAVQHITTYVAIPEKFNTELIFDTFNKELKSPNILLRRKTAITNIPISHLWPIGHNVSVNPSTNIIISWNSEKSEITLDYPSGKSELYIPITEPTIAPPSSIIKKEPFEMLIREAVNTPNSVITWKSNLYGTMYLSPTPGTFQLNIDWNIPIEISQIYFPPNTTIVSGIITFTHTLENTLENNTNTVLTVFDLATNSTFFLAYTYINDKKFSLQFIPEAEILTDLSQETIITATPALPKMIFELANINN